MHDRLVHDRGRCCVDDGLADLRSPDRHEVVVVQQRLHDLQPRALRLVGLLHVLQRCRNSASASRHAASSSFVGERAQDRLERGVDELRVVRVRRAARAARR